MKIQQDGKVRKILIEDGDRLISEEDFEDCFKNAHVFGGDLPRGGRLSPRGIVFAGLVGTPANVAASEDQKKAIWERFVEKHGKESGGVVRVRRGDGTPTAALKDLNAIIGVTDFGERLWGAPGALRVQAEVYATTPNLDFPLDMLKGEGVPLDETKSTLTMWLNGPPANYHPRHARRLGADFVIQAPAVEIGFGGRTSLNDPDFQPKIKTDGNVIPGGKHKETVKGSNYRRSPSAGMVRELGREQAEMCGLPVPEGRHADWAIRWCGPWGKSLEYIGPRYTREPVEALLERMGHKHKDTNIYKLQHTSEESADGFDRGDPSEYRRVANDERGYKLINNKTDDRFNTYEDIHILNRTIATGDMDKIREVLDVEGFTRGGVLALLQANWDAFCASWANAWLYNVGRPGDKPKERMKRPFFMMGRNDFDQQHNSWHRHSDGRFIRWSDELNLLMPGEVSYQSAQAHTWFRTIMPHMEQYAVDFAETFLSKMTHRDLMTYLGTDELFDGKGLWDTMGGDVWRAAKNARETRFRWTTDQLKRHAIGQELFNDGQQEGQGIEHHWNMMRAEAGGQIKKWRQDHGVSGPKHSFDMGELEVPIRPSNLM
jgi:hypothetical protein